ncbi:hypothetical protein [Paenibacillus faecalis]|uniref:hypothetical protein n=1 Tax=Paenibacillus faecalis TaxID=2079532 RepID=UPI0018F88E06|nr:hypothetical protein [Paenibacillus faecalis]
MLTVHTVTPYHYQYPRPQPLNTMRKEPAEKKTVTFHEVLKEKMNEKITKQK